jgi:hypothetical protein
MQAELFLTAVRFPNVSMRVQNCSSQQDGSLMSQRQLTTVRNGSVVLTVSMPPEVFPAVV